MDQRTNPFNELYVTETVSSSAFVRIFSPFILKNASALFLPGNVVIKGMQGCGKSMLLSLLKPVDLSPKLRQTFKTHFSSNGELSHGSRTQEVHERV
jgi:ABC-type lipoprotein export system ATPase subunit